MSEISGVEIAATAHATKTTTVNTTVIDMQPVTPDEREAYKAGGIGGLLTCLERKGKLNAEAYAPGSATRNTSLFSSEGDAYQHARKLHIPEGFIVLRVEAFRLQLYCVDIRRDTDKGKQTLLKVGDEQPQTLWCDGASISVPGVVTLIAL